MEYVFIIPVMGSLSNSCNIPSNIFLLEFYSPEWICNTNWGTSDNLYFCGLQEIYACWVFGIWLNSTRSVHKRHCKTITFWGCNECMVLLKPQKQKSNSYKN
jgi:hypothetical protein